MLVVKRTALVMPDPDEPATNPTGGPSEATARGDGNGVEYESRWSDIADANIAHAHTQGATGRGSVIRGDATRLAALLPAALHGQVALVVTSPPYGPTVHGLVRPGADGVAKYDNA